MTDVLMFADTERSADLFHAIPVAITDPFLYAEAQGRRIAVVGHIDHEGIRQADPGIELRDPFDFGRRALMTSGLSWLATALETSRRAVAELGVRRAVVPWDFPAALADLLRADGVEVVPDEEAFAARRRVKTPAQLEGIRRAQRAADAAMARAAQLVREARAGLTSESVREAMQAVCADHGAALSDDVIVAVNGQAANGHDSGSGPIAAGDVVLVDIWPRDKPSRCWADMTRTFIAGGREPAEEIADYWRMSRAALDAVVGEVRPGADGRELNAIACGVFEAAGLATLRTTHDGEPLPDRGFLHGLGHGVGLDVHEAPGLGLSGEPLVPGDVVAIEPGCYRAGVGGVRLEDLVLVTQDGAEVLTRFPYEM